jgi:TPP-dependent pyruvate/acetoin dehydrogenase alpha subunit
MDLLRRENILDKLKKSEAPAAQANDPLAQLEKLSKLKDAGILSEDEFNAKKAELLAKI